MSKCELVSACIFFNDKMANMPGMSQIYKQRYCLETKEECARYSVFRALGRGNVPKDLFPNQPERVSDLIG